MKTCLKTVSLALAITLLALLCACGAGPASSDSDAPAAMGRYVETSLSLPEVMQAYHFGVLADGTLQFAGIRQTGSDKWSVGIWRSQGGEDWQPLEEDWAKQLEDYFVTAMTMDTQENIWFVHEVFGPEFEAAREAGDEEAMNAMEPELRLAKVENGQIIDQPPTFWWPEYFEVLENGDILAAYYSELKLLDGQTGEERYSIESGSRLLQGTFFARDGQLYVTDGERAQVYDLATGKAVKEVPFTVDTTRDLDSTWSYSSITAGQTGITPGADGNMYYVNSSGIYRTTPDGGLTEKVVDGALCSLSSPVTDVWQVAPGADGSFYALFLDSQGTPLLKSYRYDESVPATPTTQLKVWSLEDSTTLRQAASGFQRQNPDVMIDFAVGVTPDSGILASDAINGLVTEMLAGEGPDVLLLDGLPVATWQEKGMLAELGALLEEGALDGMLPNLRKALAPEGQPLYTLPARFTAPTWYGDAENLAHTASLESLADFLQDQTSPMIGLDADAVMQYLYPLYQDRWFGADGRLQKDVLQQDLAAIGRITALYQGKELTDMYGDLIINAAYYAKGAYPVSLGSLRSMGDFTADYTLKTEGAGAVYFHNLETQEEAAAGGLDSFPGMLMPAQNASGSIFTPAVLLGVNEDSAQKQLAARFVAYALSPEVQQHDLGDGLPVNAESLKAQQVITEERMQYGVYVTYGMTYTNPFAPVGDDFLVLSVQWPDEAYFEEADAMLAGLTTPVYENRVVRDILVEETLGYLHGEKGLDETMAALSQKLDLYIAETA